MLRLLILRADTTWTGEKRQADYKSGRRSDHRPQSIAMVRFVCIRQFSAQGKIYFCCQLPTTNANYPLFKEGKFQLSLSFS